MTDAIQIAIPRGASGDLPCRILHAVLADEFPTYGSIQTRTGASKSSISYWLHKMRSAGLVSFIDRRQGTIRPAVQVVVMHLG